MSTIRTHKLADLTRWNRAGLSRFDYVDGDAAVWLEELRLAAMGLYARGADFDQRIPETWRYLFSEDKKQWPSSSKLDAFFEALAWKTLARDFPNNPETSRQRNKRLLSQYHQTSEDYGWEIMRAAARAAHVLLGHLNAYANEGYIRTATQWQNVARLAAMVNYQAAPAASATTTVGLIVKPTSVGLTVELERGLAMKYAPPEGGAPVIFETLALLKVHADLNEWRAKDWNNNPKPLATLAPDEDMDADDEDKYKWIDDPQVELTPGSLGVLENETNSGSVDAIILASVVRDANANIATLTMNRKHDGWLRGQVKLHLEAKEIRHGLPRSTGEELVLRIDTASNYAINSPVRICYSGITDFVLVVGNADGHLKLSSPVVLDNGKEVSVESLVPVFSTGSGSLAPALVNTTAYYMKNDGSLGQGEGFEEFVFDASGVRTTQVKGIDFSAVGGATGSVYVTTEGAKRESALVVGAPAKVLPTAADYHADRIVSFSGKPPKGLTIGAIFVQRQVGEEAPEGLRVVGISQGTDQYSLQFHRTVTDDINAFKPDEFEFHGPMTRSLRPLNYARNPQVAFDGSEIIFSPIANEARALLRLGKVCLVEDERGLEAPVLATLVEAVEQDDGLKLVLEPDEGLADFKKGWTKINFNAVKASHGETKSPKVLGAGDAEKPSQSFQFKSKDVSFIPSTVAEVGVAPDMDVAVDGVIWPYQDLINPAAAGTDSYSISVNEDNSLNIFFRRRLPTGTNNLVVRRYRTGVGRGGQVPAMAYTKPMKKHRYVTAITQPFAATGGAGREPVEEIRTNAPGRLAANGRAVSLKDFERLCQRRSDVWQAKAKPVTNPAMNENVVVILVPSEGGAIGPTLRNDLIEFIESRTLPGVRVAIQDYVPVKLMVETTIRVDVEMVDKTKIQADAQGALINAFSLKNRNLGQPVYISEVVAALERVDGVETATVQSFGVSVNEQALLRIAKTGGSPSAYFPFDQQLISAQPSSAVTDFNVTVEPL